MELKIERNKYSPAEVALLGIFAFGLLLSLLLVSSRKKIPLSPPVIAPFDGLKISMPSGRGWKTYDKWLFSNSEGVFVLISMLQKSSRSVATVSWKYYMNPEDKTLDQVISQKASEGGFAKVRTDKIKVNELDFTLLIFTSPVRDSSTGIEDYYYAICKLPLGSLLTLEIRTRGDDELARRAFNAALKGFDYTADWPPPDKDSIVMRTCSLQHRA